MKAVFENMEAKVDQNAVDKKCGEIERKTLLITNENLIAECLSKDVFYTATDSVLNVSRFSTCMMHSIIAQKRVKGASAASRSKPRSNTKKDRTLPAKSALKQVEAHSRMNKSNEKHKNRVDSSISYKRTVINSNSNTSCKTCNKCLISVNHDQCVVRSEMCVKQSSATKVWRVKQVKQVWKATGKLFTTIGHQWRPTGRLLPLGDQWPLTRNTPPKVLPTKQWKPTGRLLPLGRQCPLVRSTALKSDCLPADPQETIAPVVQIVLWYLDSGCSKHMTGDRSRLRNFVKKFIGTVRFGNDHFGAIMGYGDYVIGDSVISRVYYVEGLGHNLFSVGQFCDSDLEVAFRKHTCFVRDLDSVDLIKGSRGTNLYTISVEDMMRSSPICLLSKASKNKSWLWHRRLNHLNFGTLNDLARKDLVRGLPRLKFEKDHLCSACQLGKSRKATYKPKTINTIMEVLHTLHMDLCRPLRVQSINGKKYILVIVDDYSRFTWVKFLRSKDETPIFVINLLKQLQVGLNKTVWFVRTDNGTEFVNKNLTDYYESVGITHEKTIPRTSQQNGIVERRNRTLVEAARTMLMFSKAPLFLWAEAVASACYTQNRSLIHTLHNKTPYELVHDKKPDLSFLRIFGALCYPTNDSRDLGKLKAKADIGFFVGYAPNKKTAPVHSSSGLAPKLLMLGPISSGLVPNSAPAIPYVPPTNKDLELLFQPMFDEYFETLTGDHQMPHVPAAPTPAIPTGPSVSISFDHDAPSGSHSPSSSAHQSSSVHHGVATEHSFKVNPFAATEHEPFVNMFTPDLNSEASSSEVSIDIKEGKLARSNSSTKANDNRDVWLLMPEYSYGWRPSISDYGFAYNHIPLEQVEKGVVEFVLLSSEVSTVGYIPLRQLPRRTIENSFSPWLSKFWDTMLADDRIAESYKFNLDEQWFYRTKRHNSHLGLRAQELQFARFLGASSNRAHIDYGVKIVGRNSLNPFHHFTKDKKNKRDMERRKYRCGASCPGVYIIFNSKEKTNGTVHHLETTSALTEPSGHDESSSLYVELGLTESDTESDEEMPPVVKSGDQDEGRLYHRPSQRLSLLASFINDKPSEADNEKTTTDIEAESMVSITIHQDTSAIPLMTSPVIDLVTSPVIDLVSRPDSPNVHRPLPTTATATATTTTTITTLPLPP
ncbi:retrovirus-related pol polyprotein from transposon TNT 1-94 [Tanacetum coccineum]